MYRMYRSLRDRLKRFKWEKADSYKRIDMVKDAAYSKCMIGFSHIVRGDTASRVIQLFGRLNEDEREFEDVLFRGESLFAGNRMHNDMVVYFTPDFSVSSFIHYRERMKDIEYRYPRLSYVMVIDTHSIQNDSFKDMNIVYLKEYDSPEAVVNKLGEFTVDPKNCIIPTSGGGI